jgi:hypothetical protein
VIKKMGRDPPEKQWIGKLIRVSNDLIARVDEVVVAANRAPILGFGG